MPKKDKKKSPVKYWQEVMGGKYLTGEWMRRNVWYILLLVAMSLLYVNNRYRCEQVVLDNRRVSDSLFDYRCKALTVRTIYTEMTQRRNVEHNLQDTTLHTPTTPIYEVNGL